MNILQPILCDDGTIISVQASSGHYCSPRSDNPDKGYAAVETMITSDDKAEPKGHVPAAQVMELIAKHGGAIGGQLPPLNFGHYDVKETKGDEEE